MKRRITKVKPDGSREVYEIDDEAPALRKAQQPSGQLASQGQKGDTELAHVNPWEQALLKRLGGAGTQNPQTGLKQFYTSPTGSDVNHWYQYYLGREPDPAGYDYWTQYGSSPDQTADPFSAWRAAATPEMIARNTTTGGGGDTGGTGGGGGGGINIPTDIFPSSTSQGTSSSEQSASNLGVGGSENVSMNQSSNYAGLPASYQEALLAAIMPTLQNAITNMPGNIDQYTNQALGSYQQMMQNALRTALPRAMAGLANRGIINSTEGQKVLGEVGSTAAIDAANKGYTTAMQAALLKANMPQMLSQIMDLGKTSYGTSTGAAAGSSANINMGQSSGTSSSQQGSYWEDPTVMYRTLADVIRSMMPSNY